MSTTLVILVVEAVVILTGVAGFLFFLILKPSKKKNLEFENLLDKFGSKEK